jgi:hypothetical protein
MAGRLSNPSKDQNETYGKNDDHIAQMVELLGKSLNIRGYLRRIPPK